MKLQQPSVELAKSLTDTVAATQFSDQDESLPWSTAFSSIHTFFLAVNALLQQPVVDNTYDSEFGKALASLFGCGALIVDMPTSILPAAAQDNESIIQSSRIETTPGSVFTPINIDLNPAQYSSFAAALPDLSGSDLDALNPDTTSTHAYSMSPQTIPPNNSSKHHRAENLRASPSRKRPALEVPMLGPSIDETGPPPKRQKW